MILLLASLNYGQLVKKTADVERIGYKSFTATAYCMGSRTATGVRVKKGHIAVDPKWIPLNSKVEILNLGVFNAVDTGSAIKKNKIDIYMSCKDAKIWGVRRILLRIL